MGRTKDLELRGLEFWSWHALLWTVTSDFSRLGLHPLQMVEGLIMATWLVWWGEETILYNSTLLTPVAMLIRQWVDQHILWESWKSFSVGEWVRWMLEGLGKVCIDLDLTFLLSLYLYCSVHDGVGGDSFSGPNSFSLVFPPPTLGSPPVCQQSAVCCEGEAGDSLGSGTVAAGSYCT